MIRKGSRVRVTVNGCSVVGRVTRVISRGEVAGSYYWDLEYEIENPRLGRGTIGRWKQQEDTGYVEEIDG